MSVYAESRREGPAEAESGTAATGQARARAGAVLVWAVWLAMLAAGLLFIARYGSNVPSWDDWDMVPTFTGEQPVTLEWLWSQHNEHRVPVPRLAMLALVRLTVVDFRVLMVANLLAMSAVAAGMIVAARRLRGRASVADVFFPLVLLHWGHAANLLWGWQLQFFASVMLASIALLAIGLSEAVLRPRTAGLVVGACALLLPLCGANGLVLVPGLGAWLGYSAWLARRSRTAEGRRESNLLRGLAAASLLLVAVYLIGWERVPWHPRSSGSVWTLVTALQFFTIGIGPAARGPWPFSGVAVVLLFAVTLLRLVHVWRSEPDERGRAAGFLLFLGAMATLGLALGLGRDGFEIRYVTLAAPAWCCVYLVWTAYGTRRAGPALRGSLAVAAAVALWGNTHLGLVYAQDLRSRLGGFERDMVAGVPIHELISRYGDYLSAHDGVSEDYLPMLRRAGVGKYRLLRDDPPFREVAVPLLPAETRDVRWDDSTATLIGDRPAMVFELPAEVHVAGIRLTYQFTRARENLPYVGIYWKRTADPSFTMRRFQKYSPTGDRANWERGSWTRLDDRVPTMTAWVSDTVGQIQITPNYRRGGSFRIEKLVLLVPGP